MKAHVIPKSLHAPLFTDDGPPWIFSSMEGAFLQRSQTGIYDSSILCGECDSNLGIWDQYAKELLTSSLDHFGNPPEILREQSFLVESVDYTKLKLFFISLLWRADRSSHPFFSDVDLGPWEPRARQALLKQNPGPDDFFGTMLIRYEHRLAATIHNPRRARSLGITFYQFSLPHYEAMIKVDQQPWPGDLGDFLLRCKGRLRIALFDYEESLNSKEILQRLASGQLPKMPSRTRPASD